MSLRYFHIAMEMWGSIFCIIAAVCVFTQRKINPKGSLLMIALELSNALLLCCDTLAWFYRGNTTIAGGYMVRISNFLVFSMGFVLMIVIIAYAEYLINGFTHTWNKYLVRGLYLLCVVGFILLVISQFTDLYYAFDEMNRYYRKDWFWLSQVFGIVGMLILSVLLVDNRKKLSKIDFYSLLAYILFPVAAMSAQIFLYGVALLNISITTGVLVMFGQFLADRSKRMAEQERRLNEIRTNMLLSQIQPHFTFNCLNTIRFLCKKDQQEAVRAIDDFSDFLRGTTDAITRKTCVQFERELEIVRDYLNIEKRRFGEKLQVEYEIQASGFMVPALSVQPLVENAVKHGICKRKEGGIIKITTSEDAIAYHVKIEDNGIGFDMQKQDDQENHVGIQNIRTRLQLMSRADLTIQSEVGKGTVAEISLPKA